MNVFMCFDRLAPHFGPGALAVALATRLVRRGHRVTVFVEELPEPGNQYTAAFRAAGVEVVVPGRVAVVLDRWLRLEELLLAALLPLRVPLSLADAALRRRSFPRAWRGVRGRLHGLLPARSLGQPLRWTLRRRLTRAHRHRSADLLHMYTGLGAAFEWAARHGVPLVYNENIVPSTERGVDWWRDVIRQIGSVDLTVSVCAAARPAIRTVLGYRGPIVVVPNTIPDPLANGGVPSLRPAALTGTCVLGCAARLDAVKGVDVLLRALALLDDDAQVNLQLWIAGDGPERKPLQELAGELGVVDRVRFLGHCGPDGMASFWSGADIFVLPSRWEGLPLVILEAMARAKPIVATSVDGVPEAVRDGETGALVEPDQVEALAAAIARLVRDPAARSAMGRAGRERFLAEFSIEVTLDRWLAAYEQVLGTRRPERAA